MYEQSGETSFKAILLESVVPKATDFSTTSEAILKMLQKSDVPYANWLVLWQTGCIHERARGGVGGENSTETQTV